MRCQYHCPCVHGKAGVGLCHKHHTTKGQTLPASRIRHGTDVPLINTVSALNCKKRLLGHSDTRTLRHKETETQEHSDTRTLTHKDTQTLGHSDTRTFRHKDTQTQGHSDTRKPRHKGTQTQGHSDTQTLRHKDTQTQDRRKAGSQLEATEQHACGTVKSTHPVPGCLLTQVWLQSGSAGSSAGWAWQSGSALDSLQTSTAIGHNAAAEKRSFCILHSAR